jgi:hypothetical protein
MFAAAFIPVLVIVTLVLIFQLRNRYRFILSSMRQELQANPGTVLAGPEVATFSGSDREYGRGRCNGIIALTSDRLLFRGVFGRPVQVPLQDVAAVYEDKPFQGRRTGGGRHLVLRLDDGNRLGFYVRDRERWLKLLGSVLPESGRPRE